MTNNNAFLSLRRMEEEPGNQQQHLQLFFIITGYNIRITRILNALNQQMRDAPRPLPFSPGDAYRSFLAEMMERVSDFFKDGGSAENEALPEAGEMTRKIKAILPPGAFLPEEGALRDLLERIGRETIGMYYSMQQLSAPNGHLPRQ